MDFFQAWGSGSGITLLTKRSLMVRVHHLSYFSLEISPAGLLKMETHSQLICLQESKQSWVW